MENGFQTADSKASKIVFAFPAKSQAVSPLVWRFFKLLPKVNGVDVFILTTLNKLVYITKPLYKLLKQKGYIPACLKTCLIRQLMNIKIDIE